jgi:DNA-binding transcriptional ArsR family regulator
MMRNLRELRRAVARMQHRGETWVTIRELQAEASASSCSVVTYHLPELEAEGLIEVKRKRSRGIHILAAPEKLSRLEALKREAEQRGWDWSTSWTLIDQSDIYDATVSGATGEGASELEAFELAYRAAIEGAK